MTAPSRHIPLADIKPTTDFYIVWNPYRLESYHAFPTYDDVREYVEMLTTKSPTSVFYIMHHKAESASYTVEELLNLKGKMQLS